MAEPMDIDKGKTVAGDGPSTSGKNFDLPWVSHNVAGDFVDSHVHSGVRRVSDAHFSVVSRSVFACWYAHRWRSIGLS